MAHWSDQLCRRPKIIKCVVVGNSGVGKSSLIAFLTGSSLIVLPEGHPDHQTFVSSHNSVMQEVTLASGQRYILDIHDTTSEDEGFDWRVSVYADTDVFLVCFDSSRPWDWDNVSDQWLRETTHFAQNAQRIFVGLRTDERGRESWQSTVAAHAFTSLGIPRQGQRHTMIARLILNSFFNHGELLAWRYGGSYVEGSVRTPRSELDGLAIKAVEVALTGAPQRGRALEGPDRPTDMSDPPIPLLRQLARYDPVLRQWVETRKSLPLVWRQQKKPLPLMHLPRVQEDCKDRSQRCVVM